MPVQPFACTFVAIFYFTTPHQHVRKPLIAHAPPNAPPMCQRLHYIGTGGEVLSHILHSACSACSVTSHSALVPHSLLRAPKGPQWTLTRHTPVECARGGEGGYNSLYDCRFPSLQPSSNLGSSHHWFLFPWPPRLGIPLLDLLEFRS